MARPTLAQNRPRRHQAHRHARQGHLRRPRHGAQEHRRGPRQGCRLLRAGGPRLRPRARAEAPLPSTVKTSISGYWKADKFLHGYFDTRLFARTLVPDALGFSGSSRVHMSVGLCEDDEKALREGPRHLQDHLCACKPCRSHSFWDCKMTKVFDDRMKVVNRPPASTGVTASHSASLAEFATSLRADQSVAFRVADAEGIEGPVWFAVLNGAAEALENDVLFVGQTFNKSWHVVRGHWFSFVALVEKSTDRRYIQLKDNALFNVNSIIVIRGCSSPAPSGACASVALVQLRSPGSGS